MDLFVVYTIAIDQNQQLKAWERATLEALGLKEAQTLCTNQSLHYKSWGFPSTALLLSEFCDSPGCQPPL